MIVTLADGEKLLGYRTGENGTALSLRTPGGVQRDIKKADIKEIQSLDYSLMPAGLESGLTEQELVDLVGWLLKQKKGAAK